MTDVVKYLLRYAISQHALVYQMLKLVCVTGLKDFRPRPWPIPVSTIIITSLSTYRNNT